MRSMNLNWTYDLFNLGPVPPGKYEVETQWDMQLSRLIYTQRDLASGSPDRIVELDAYVDPGKQLSACRTN